MDDDRPQVVATRDGLAIKGGMASLIAWVLYQFAVVSGAASPPQPVINANDSRTLHSVSGQVSDMHRWQSKEDDDGVKLMYVPRSWIASQQEQTEVLRSLKGSIEAQTRAYESATGRLALTN